MAYLHPDTPNNKDWRISLEYVAMPLLCTVIARKRNVSTADHLYPCGTEDVAMITLFYSFSIF